MTRAVFPIPPGAPLEGACAQFINTRNPDDKPYSAIRCLRLAEIISLRARYPDFVGHPAYYFIDEEKRLISCWPMAARGVKPEFGNFNGPVAGSGAGESVA